MAQKDKIKELVGRGLHSYHTKSLQQMDRIEKKNKEQNHKINILSNELDNDYLTKTEEGSVISLEHSKEGMVYLDELQGNTLVNYCTDGSKEMTLNGDIDVEGVSVTTTEGVDNGKVDVMCEGNTLVNISNTSIYGINKAISETNLVVTRDTNYLKATTNGEIYDNNSWVYADFGKPKLTLLKPNTKYTVIGERIKGIATMAICDGSTANALAPFTVVKDNRALLTTNDLGAEIGGQILYGYIKNNEDQKVIDIEVKNLIILEGDWTNKQIPSEYFEGMKSVGQDDENGHKIEILSQNKNLLTSDKFEKWGNEINIEYSGDVEKYVECSKTPIEVEPNTTYTFSTLMKATSNLKSAEIYLYEYKKGETKLFKATPKYVVTDNILEFTRVSYTFTTSKETDKILLRFDNNGSSDGNVAILTCKEYCLSLGNNTTYVEPMFNKKEILLNEPLRELPNGVKDKFVKIGGKYYVERNCGEIMLNGDEVWEYWNSNTGLNNDYISFYMSFNGKNYEPNVSYNLISDILVNMPNTLWYRDLTSNSVALNADINISLQIGVKKSDLQTQDVVGFKQWLKTNKPKIVYKLKTPFYEPLEIKPTLNTYSDITHISNNSIIPCNMKIKNSGYNAIIKPNTLYTVALDTNKSGTIGMNLGGVKVTTTNNVATITTPATLTDNSLRLYGKGIKGSKVRLLEGDKTNWIPSHFEGMKSSFEDKVQEDGSYKMEILSNNKNLFDIDAEYYKAGWGNQNYQRNGNGFSFDAMDGWSSIGYEVKGHRDKTVVVSATVTCINKDTSKLREQSLRVHTETWSGANGTSFLDGETKRIKFNVKLNHEGRVYFNGSSTPEGSNNGGVKWTVKDILIEDVDGGTGYFPRECNKIQFSSIEPLRGIKNIKDKFVFKDGKLMVQRNLGEVILDGNHNCSYAMYDLIMNHYNVYFRMTNVVTNKKTGGLIDNDKLPTYETILYSEDVCGFGTNDKWFENGFSLRLPRRIVGNGTDTEILNKCKQWLAQNPIKAIYQLEEPTYEEIPFELQKIILEGYENGTLFFDTNIPPTSTVTYAGETPIVKATKLNKTEVSSNTEDINDNIIPYLMDMDYRVVCLQLQSENINDGVSMARLFGGTYEMLQRDIQSKRYSVDEYKHRLDAYLDANKITEEEYNKLGDMLNE